MCYVFLTSSSFAHASNIFFYYMSCAETFYRAVVSDHYMVVMSFLRRVHPTNEEAKMSLFGFDPRMRENVYK